MSLAQMAAANKALRQKNRAIADQWAWGSNWQQQGFCKRDKHIKRTPPIALNSKQAKISSQYARRSGKTNAMNSWIQYIQPSANQMFFTSTSSGSTSTAISTISSSSTATNLPSYPSQTSTVPQYYVSGNKIYYTTGHVSSPLPTYSSLQEITDDFSPRDLWRMLMTHAQYRNAPVDIPANTELEIGMPDGGKLHVNNGKWWIDDKNAKVTYKSNNVREFNPYINASDLIAKFIDYLDSLQVKRSEVMALPIELFIQWLVIEAAKADDEPVMDSDVALFKRTLDKQALPAPKNRCFCGRFLSKLKQAKGLPFCSGAHMDKYEHRVAVAI